MADYTVTGHPLDFSDLGLTGAEAEALRNQLQLEGVGAALTITLADDTGILSVGALEAA
jgi:hypothetical protein